ncbi:MAG: metallophosphoesterase [Nitrospirota bacterium]
MRTIVHLSDLHFGRSQPSLIDPLVEIIQARMPHLIVVSGDLTQRAKTSQFRQAKELFSLLPHPVLVIPGNHDIPLYAFWTRLLNPFGRYRRHISEELNPHYRDDELAVMGVNSVRRLKWKEGRINVRQLEAIRDFFSTVPQHVVKIVVAHHPFNLPEGYRGHYIGRARTALEWFGKAGVDLLLSGHLHSTLAEYRNTAYRLRYRKPLIVQAGTPLSTRLRIEPNSFNIIVVDYPRLSVERYELDRETLTFVLARTERFLRGAEEWEPAEISRVS